VFISANFLSLGPKRQLSFKQNGNMSSVTNFYTDFDGTLACFPHYQVCGPDGALDVKKFRDIYNPFIAFIKSAEKIFKFTVTTGRNSSKFSEFFRHLRSKGPEMPLPTTLITGNGGEIYTLNNADNYFTSGQNLDISADNPLSIQKRNDIKKITNWDGDVIKSKFLSVLHEKFGLDVFDTPINEFSDTYSDTILQQLNKRGYNHQNSPFASVQDDGKLGFNIALCKDLSHNSKRLCQMKDEICKAIGNNVNYEIIATEFDNECGNGPSIRILPKVDDERLDKLYDTKLAVKTILENKHNDLVLVAGDNINDLRMLNPFSYVDLVDKNLGKIGKGIVKFEEEIYEASTKLLRDSNNKDLKNSLNSSTAKRNYLLNEAKKFLEQNPEVKEKLKDLPFISLAVKRDGVVTPVSNEVREFFAFSQKNLLAEPDKLLNSVKDAMKMYAARNPKYEQGLSVEIRELLGLTQKILTKV